jgi:hypothetical protein
MIHMQILIVAVFSIGLFAAAGYLFYKRKMTKLEFGIYGLGVVGGSYGNDLLGYIGVALLGIFVIQQIIEVIRKK